MSVQSIGVAEPLPAVEVLEVEVARTDDKPVYLDYNATSPTAPRVVAAMMPFFAREYGNASSCHAFGRQAHDAMNIARSRVADMLSCRPEEIVRHPLARALRVDKLTLAALEATITGPLPPVARSLTADPAALTDRAERIVATLAAHHVPASVVASEAAVGGGGAPGVTLPSAAVALPEELALPLRCGAAVRRGDSPAVVGRVEKGQFLLDLRSTAPEDDNRLIAAIVTAASTHA